MCGDCFPVKSDIPAHSILTVTLVECGYCKGTRHAKSLFEIRMSPKALSADAYEHLMFAGWRRLRSMLYIQNKPEENCCPLYPIRLDATAFRASKSQRHILAKWRKFLAHETDDYCVPFAVPPPVVASEQVAAKLSESFRCIVTKLVGGKDGITATLLESIKVQPNMQCHWASRGSFSTSAAVFLFHKCSVIRESFSDVKSFAEAITVELQKVVADARQGLNVKMLSNGIIEFFDDHPVCEPATKRMKLKPRSFEMKALKSSSFDREEFELYRKYQIAVHHDKPEDVTEESSDFLWMSNLVYEKLPNDVVLPCGIDSYGTYHMQYRVDGRLLAMEVIDVLPHSISSVYEIHDPDMNIDMGTVTVLKEIEMIAALRETIPQIKYYCLGYYLHTCQKMRYKGFFHPSELFCRQTGNWVPLDSKCRALLDAGEAASKPWVNIDPSSLMRAEMTEDECFENLKRMYMTKDGVTGTMTDRTAKILVPPLSPLFQLTGPWFADAFCLVF